MSGPTNGIGAPPPDHRLPADTEVGGVRLQVADLDRSLVFYEEVLGLRPLRRTPDGAALGASEGDDEAALVELRERPDARPAPRHGRLGLYHFALLLPGRADLGRFLRHLVELGVHPGASDHLVSEALYLDDPDGLGIEVYADRPRSEWRMRDDELVMATEPLDQASLLQAGGEAPWDGMPPGTTVGHVHLHVGRLDRAARFYHEALGLDRTVWSYPGALFLSAGGYHHHLGLNTWAGDAPPAGEDEARLLEWELRVPTADASAAAEASLEGAGYRVEPHQDGFRVEDPWGTALRVRAEDGG